MKNLFILLFIFIVITSWAQIPLVNTLSYPEGTQFNQISNSTYNIILPIGYDFLIFDENGEQSIGSTVCYSCSGACSDGCNVIYSPGGFKCSACTQSVDCKGSTKKCPDGTAIEKLYIVNLELGIDFVGSEADLENLNSLPFNPDIISFLELELEFASFYNDLYGTSYPSDDYFNSIDFVILPMKAFGNLVGMRVPISYITDNNLYSGFNMVSGDNHVSCDCLDRGVGCNFSTLLTTIVCIKKRCGNCRMVISAAFQNYFLQD